MYKYVISYDISVLTTSPGKKGKARTLIVYIILLIVTFGVYFLSYSSMVSAYGLDTHGEIEVYGNARYTGEITTEMQWGTNLDVNGYTWTATFTDVKAVKIGNDTYNSETLAIRPLSGSSGRLLFRAEKFDGATATITAQLDNSRATDTKIENIVISPERTTPISGEISHSDTVD